jgi:alanyl aminopeptidase
MRRGWAVSFRAAATACAAAVLGAGVALATPDPGPPRLRLPAIAAPTGYRVALAIDPGKETFRGSVDVAVLLTGPTELLWLNASGLKIERAEASAAGSPVGVRVVPGGADFVGFAFDRPAAPGDLALHVDYTGAIDETSTQGVFRQKDGDSWYAFTQFETSDARRAFPCFDEPSFKTPWELTLTIPAGTSAVSNTPVSSETAGEGGTRVVRFGKTDPLPAYLVAFAVGPFDYVEAGRAGMRKTPIRIVVPRGKASRARYAAETTGPLLERLEAYFGTPFPFSKLDQLAIPQTATFGAMENAGLITWGEAYLLASPEEETIKFRRTQASYNAHEIAHQWFGDLVTLTWWNDVWLNESFATWMADRTVQEWKPEWNIQVDRVVDRSNVMAFDTLVSARKIRQEIESNDDIVNAFDPISYQKGAAVLSMFEAWIGPEKFRSGVRRYLAAHRFGNATSKDFLDAIQAESRPGVAAAFASFLDQPGTPLAEVSLDCGSGGGAKLSLSQKRFLPVGTTGSTAQTWRVPVCARSEAGRACALLTEPSGSMASPAFAGGCPAWLLANDGEVGYYRALYRGDLLGKLLAVADTRLSVAERVGLLRDIDALAMGGAFPMGEALALAPRFAGDPDRQIVLATIRIASDAGEKVVPRDLRSAYARFVSKTFGERARALGLSEKRGEDEETRLLRTTLVPFVARNGDEPALRAEARRLALAWLADSSAVGAEMAQAVLETAARHGDRALLSRYEEGVKTAKERRDRVRLFHALGAFGDPAILKDALAFAGQFDIRESGYVFFQAIQTPEGQRVAWEFLQANYDAIVARMPREATGTLPYFASGFCDAGDRRQVADFFGSRVEKLPGGPRNLAQVLEEIDLCIALSAAQEGSVREFLKGY